MKIICSPYVDMDYPMGVNLADNLSKVDELFCYFLKATKWDIENRSIINLVARGSSGAIICTLFLVNLVKLYPDKTIKIIHLKKEGEKAHASKNIWRGDFEPDEEILNVFVDDLIDSGLIVIESVEAIRKSNDDLENFKFHYITAGRSINLAALISLTEHDVSEIIVDCIYSETIKKVKLSKILELKNLIFENLEDLYKESQGLDINIKYINDIDL